MKTIKTYETIDGRVFDDYDDAIRHEATEAIPAKLGILLQDTIANQNLGYRLSDDDKRIVVKALVGKFEEFFKVFAELDDAQTKLDRLEVKQQVIGELTRKQTEATHA